MYLQTTPAATEDRSASFLLNGH